jgi:hypothetical protein
MTQEALKLALEALSVLKPDNWVDKELQGRAWDAVKEALAQEQEPVATLDDLEQEIYENTRQFVSRDVMEWMLKRYYTTPPQRKPLTIGDVKIIWQNLDVREGVIMGLVRAVEAAHDIKENT